METTDMLVCPETKIPLRECSLEEAKEAMCVDSPLRWRTEGFPNAVGPTARVMLREDSSGAYPIVDGVPLLLFPEMLFPKRSEKQFDLKNPMWAEAYEEMEFYNAVCIAETNQLLAGGANPLPPNLARHVSTFPYPTDVWLDEEHDACGQLDCYLNLGNISGMKVLQLGGKGRHAVKFLVAGAKEAWLVTPMVGECLYAKSLARTFGVEDRLHCVAAVGEQIPLKADSVDIVYSGGCIHHMVAEVVAREVHRVLRSGGRFSALEPGQTLLHAIGTRVLGKREPVHCKPINSERLAPFYSMFERFRVERHGPLLRYLMIGACKLLKKNLSAQAGYRIGRFEDALFGHVPFLRERGGSLAILGAKEK
jgi:uncharacterized protein YbaR (Trm112 family)